ncbi:hypothetical protein Tco_0115748 [Tanacetum coccineum]
MDNSNITIEEYIRLEEEKARKRGKVFNWATAKYGKICSLDNKIDFRISFDESDDEDYTSLFFSTVDTAYSLNEYSVFDTRINTAYPEVWIWHIDFLYSLVMLASRSAFTTHNLARERNLEDHTKQISGEFLILILLISCF